MNKKTTGIEHAAKSGFLRSMLLPKKVHPQKIEIKPVPYINMSSEFSPCGRNIKLRRDFYKSCWELVISLSRRSKLAATVKEQCNNPRHIALPQGEKKIPAEKKLIMKITNHKRKPPWGSDHKINRRTNAPRSRENL